MKRTSLLTLMAAVLLAAPALASEDVPDDIHAGYAVGGVLVGTGVVTGVVAFIQWKGLSDVQDGIYSGGTATAELDLLIEDGNGYMLRGIIFSSVAGLTLVSGLVTLASTSDRHAEWRRQQSEALLHRRRPALAGLSLTPNLHGGLQATVAVRW